MIRHLFGNQFSAGILSETIYRAVMFAVELRGYSNRYSFERNKWMKYLYESRTPRAIVGPSLARAAHLWNLGPRPWAHRIIDHGRRNEAQSLPSLRSNQNLFLRFLRDPFR